MKTNKKTVRSAKAVLKFVIVGHSNYGLKYGTLSEPVQAALDRGSCVLKDGGNIFRYDTTPAQGGPSTLAVVGPNGSSTNKIGKASAELGVADLKAIYVCTPEAAAKFAPYTK